MGSPIVKDDKTKAQGHKDVVTAPSGTVKKKSAAQPPSKPDGKRNGKADVYQELDLAFIAKVAVYERGLAAGIGMKALKPELLQKVLKSSIGPKILRKRAMQRAEQAISEANISHGVDSAAVAEAVDVFLKGIDEGDTRMVTRKVALGDLPEPGEDGRLLYLLNPDNLPMHKVAGVPPTSKKRWFRMVHKGEALVEQVPAKPGKAGRSVTGEPVAAKKPEEVSLTSVMGGNTAAQEDRLIAESEGACEENATGRVRVVPEVVVNVVDAVSGNLPQAGISKASILVKQAIKSGYGVLSSESVFVGAGSKGGVVEQKARVTAANLVVNGKILGAYEEVSGADPNALDIQDVCAAREIDGHSVLAAQILVVGDCRLARLDADEAIFIDGDLVGGQAICRQVLSVAGNVGSKEGGSHTRVIVPKLGGPSRRQKRLAMIVHKQMKVLTEFQAKLSRLDDSAAKRAKSDPYWALLLSGDYRDPRNPVEANTLRQFRDMTNEQKDYSRSVREAREAILQLQEQAKDVCDGTEASSACVRVGGRLYLDASLEVAVEASEDAMESQVTYKIDGKRFRNYTLKDIHSELLKQARAYMEAHAGHVQERREAIDKMFEGTEHKPTGPQVKHKRFELPFAWGEEEETSGGAAGVLQISVMAFVDTSMPRQLHVRTVATPREALDGVEIVISQEGSRAGFTVGGYAPSQGKWQENTEILQRLDSIMFRGMSAREFLEGKALPEEGGENAK